ncbi:hypothetical protein EV651_125104 [Kribbella sp. VKM Ac-2571]|uniref:hypothetical protein n=1 Tax=Kribbella sp. VKM Ac-2571 TaxID=2512222 RepID=UPI00105BBD8F|nr:hypothetical protein [Kribbella sp. VKM Ac-2571]TDO47110.1 hypothetical protein EV651_125104 [Kribbella sp. VKM Ac-2571]
MRQPLLCKRCHRDLHAGHWNIQITNGTVQVTRPTWATPATIPRNRYRPPTTTSGTSRPDAAGAGAPVRAWPRDTDPPWITPEETARLNPWGDAHDSDRLRDPRSAQGPEREDDGNIDDESATDPRGEARDSPDNNAAA